MSTLPFTLPTCAQSATARLEVYSPANGDLAGSLDANVYTCDQHSIEAVTSIWTADLIARRVPLAPDIERTCGDVHIYATGTLADHPAWCDRKACGDRGEHRSVELGVKRGPDDLVFIAVHLVQPVDTDTPLVMLSFHVEDPDSPVEQLIALDQAMALTYRIRTLAEQAKGGRR